MTSGVLTASLDVGCTRSPRAQSGGSYLHGERVDELLEAAMLLDWRVETSLALE